MKIDMNRRLAELLGWTNITEVNVVRLSGIPPGPLLIDALRLFPVPNWCGDWAACGPLLALYKLNISTSNYDFCSILMRRGTLGVRINEHYIEHASRDDAIRYAIVRAVEHALAMDALK